ncbi:tetratricopeptide repeat protein [Campylobacter fetus]|uniref:tetratricopeptide repeat protein n=1 Tax=Campylobacter fetus TaxID=196 RepID=UPI001000877D|nr:hypothetical protein [Campylobacter fetus]RUT50494.1 hypothetical protein BWK67_04725 [Campylobacter fetus]RUT50811.1 hypothetical protein BWK51_04705 [Campylobacter fetus]
MKKFVLGLVALVIMAFGGDWEDGKKAYENGDYAKAAKLFQKACDDGDALSCYNLGVSYSNGQGVKQNKKKAKELYGKAYDMGDQLGCDAYSKLNSQGY